MATSNRDRIGKGIDLLVAGLRPYVEREMKAAYKERWEGEARAAGMSQTRVNGGPLTDHWDAPALLRAILDHWQPVFSRKFGNTERNIVHELRDVRNRWAHNEPFNTSDAYRALDSIERLLLAVSAPQQKEVEEQKNEVMRQRYEDAARREERRAAVAPVEGKPQVGLKPWREVVLPHPDVASGRYQQAEFAADLNQVYQGEGAVEYRDPRDFFARTFLTEGLKQLLGNAVERLAGSGGDPVVKLQTNFGGGKTHAMLALYHLLSGTPPGELPGADQVLAPLGAGALPTVQRAVLVGTALSPAQPRRKPDGITVRTMWGELAWQLLGHEGYELVQAADEAGVSPGSDVLHELLGLAAPCLILIDEWVAYLRQLADVENLPAGSFDANYSFAQALTEAARATPQALVVASLPASDIEIGGEAGRESLVRLANTFGRMESVWRPATTEESFEIVRRRLFQPLAGQDLYAARDAVVRAYGDYYRSQPQEFPPDCREGDYARRMTTAYPIHPELFDRLYNDWSTLERFQRTRGVLRLMAAVIHSLWVRNDQSLLILPASVPIDDPAVRDELTRYLDDNWLPVIEQDVDGPSALPLAIDKENPNLGRYSATRRVARTLFLGSAPTLGAANRGIDDRLIRLGCGQPGESVATFGDALRRLTDQATFLYVEGSRYWYSTQPSATRVAQDRAASYRPDAVFEEIARRLREEARQRGDFLRVHAAPTSSGDVPDELDARLVILDPEHPHIAKSADSPARRFAAQVLESRGSSPRRYRNTLVFLAPDTARLDELAGSVRLYLAWKSIHEESDSLGLDPFQRNQAAAKSRSADETVVRQIPEVYSWLLVPTLSDPTGREVEWDEIRATGDERLAVKAGKKLRNEDRLLTELAGTVLRLWLDRVPLWRDDRVEVRQLIEDFAQYLYLPRLQSDALIPAAVRHGVGQMMWAADSFAYADRFDPVAERYVGLVGGQFATISPTGLVVKPDAALAQMRTDEEAARQHGLATRGGDGPRSNGHANDGRDDGYDVSGSGTGTTTISGGTAVVGSKQPVLRRYHGSVQLDPVRLGRDAGQIADAIVAHLAGLVGARVRVTLEIEADLPDGVTEQVLRTVSENARTLKVTGGFEEE